MSKTLSITLCVLTLLAPGIGAAAVDCSFRPAVVKAGEYGGAENLLFVCDESIWTCYNLGLGTDAQARNRHSIAMSALLSGKLVFLRFWNETSCTSAQQNSAVPNSIWIKNT